jgi:hypothetical protein
MGTFAETAIVDISIYLLLIKENKLPFSVSIAANKRKLSVSVCSKQTEVVIFC